MRATTVAPGKAASVTSRLFAGAKETTLLEGYTDEGGVALFDRAIDWGWFRWFEKPIFYLLDWLFHAIGNFGVAIICLTFVVRGLMFPVAQKQFASMAAMRAHPAEDEGAPGALQGRQARRCSRRSRPSIKSEKVNPLAGCLPIFLQIPIFFALYKVLMLTIEMRHQPFVAVDQGSLGARSAAHPQSVRPARLSRRPSFLAHRPARDPARHHHVPAVQAQSGADGRYAEADLRRSCPG